MRGRENEREAEKQDTLMGHEAKQAQLHQDEADFLK